MLEENPQYIVVILYYWYFAVNFFFYTVRNLKIHSNQNNTYTRKHF